MLLIVEQFERPLHVLLAADLQLHQPVHQRGPRPRLQRQGAVVDELDDGGEVVEGHVGDDEGGLVVEAAVEVAVGEGGPEDAGEGGEDDLVAADGLGEAAVDAHVDEGLVGEAPLELGREGLAQVERVL